MNKDNTVTAKYIELDILKDLSLTNDKVIAQKEELLKIETSRLEEFHDKIWILQNQICDEVWDFSRKHDFNIILNSYPDVPAGFSFNCICKVINDTNVETQNLLLEIQKLELDFGNEKCDELKIDLTNIQKELQKCKEESYEVQKLKKNIIECKNRVTDLKEKIEMKYNKVQIDPNNFFGNNLVQSSTIDSSVSTNYFNEINMDICKPIKSVIHVNNNLKKKLIELNDEPYRYIEQNVNVAQFVKTSTFMKIRESQIKKKNVSSCEKIIAEAELSNEKSISSVNQPKKKFVLKTKSLITQKLLG